ncbi:hypothetical protein B296_00046654 [Ensete ventricosum]|uniref:Uncharacterized protein n=1 Tax=Ensete ventricosum TaxID=4639 RepID=A0A426Z355_ENSVE|nr:hypothetical protein B296_00046654 [Ensete ventricosum]
MKKKPQASNGVKISTCWKKTWAEAHLRTLAYKKAVTKLYNRKVRPWFIKSCDLVLRKTEVSDPTRSRDKLAAN